MSERIATHLPVPHLFMVLSIGIFAAMAVLALAPGDASGSAAEAAQPAAGDGSGTEVVVAIGAGPAVGATHLASGGPATLDSAGIAFVSVVALLGLLAATLQAGRVRRHGAGRPLMGLFAGLLAGVAGAASLSSLGAIPLASPVWVYLPLVLATLGAALGVTAPFRATAGRGLRSVWL